MTLVHRHAGNVDAHRELATREYPHGTRARYNAQKCRCFDCRRANARYESERQRDPRIPAEPVRQHLEALSAQGVGFRAVSDATDIPCAALRRWRLGQPTIRRSQAERILAVDSSAIADHGLVDASETKRLLRELVADGYTKTRLAAQLGSEARVPALQYKGDRVLAKTAMRVRKLHAMLLAEGDDVAAPTPSDVPRERIVVALQWFESVTAEDLFDAIEVPHHERSTYSQALHRLFKVGAVERIGSKPYLYRRPA